MSGLVNLSLGEIGNVFKDIREAVTGKAISDPADKIKMLEALHNAEAKMLEHQASTIVAEAESEHWIVSSWRPITMLVFVTIIANNYIVAPYFKSFGYIVPTLDIPPNMWTLLQIGLGGYIAGRSIEKTAKVIKGVL